MPAGGAIASAIEASPSMQAAVIRAESLIARRALPPVVALARVVRAARAMARAALWADALGAVVAAPPLSTLALPMLTDAME